MTASSKIRFVVVFVPPWRLKVDREPILSISNYIKFFKSIQICWSFPRLFKQTKNTPSSFVNMIVRPFDQYSLIRHVIMYLSLLFTFQVNYWPQIQAKTKVTPFHTMPEIKAYHRHQAKVALWLVQIQAYLLPTANQQPRRLIVIMQAEGGCQIGLKCQFFLKARELCQEPIIFMETLPKMWAECPTYQIQGEGYWTRNKGIIPRALNIMAMGAWPICKGEDPLDCME